MSQVSFAIMYALFLQKNSILPVFCVVLKDSTIYQQKTFLLYFFFSFFPLIFFVVVYRPPLLTLNWQADILKAQIRSVLLQMHEEIVCWSDNTLSKEDLSSDSDSAKYFGVCPWELLTFSHFTSLIY